MMQIVQANKDQSLPIKTKNKKAFVKETKEIIKGSDQVVDEGQTPSVASI